MSYCIVGDFFIYHSLLVTCYYIFVVLVCFIVNQEVYFTFVSCVWYVRNKLLFVKLQMYVVIRNKLLFMKLQHVHCQQICTEKLNK